MEPQVNFAQLPDVAIVQILQGLPLYDLVHYPQDDRRMRDLLRLARRHRRELTLAIGFHSQNVGRESLLWHKLQNDLRQFRGGWHEMLHETFAGEYDWFLANTRQIIINYLPNVTSLNIMFDCDVPGRRLSIENMLHLIRHYAPNLVTFRLWASGPMFTPVDNERHSAICHAFVGRLFNEVRQMTNLETLWLDLKDRNLDLDETFVVNPAPDLPLQHLFRNAAATFPRLREFRYASSANTNYFRTFAWELAPIPTLRCIYIARGPHWYHDWSYLQPDIASKFLQISVGLRPFRDVGERVLDHELLPLLPNLVHFFGLFNALTRVTVQLAEDILNVPRFLTLFRALAQVPNLLELKVEIFSGQIFTEEEYEEILVDRPQPLNALQILVIEMAFNVPNCADFAVWQLFSDPPGDRPLERVVVPNLVCFKMKVVAMAVCNRCPTEEECAFNAINYTWFRRIRSIVFVQIFICEYGDENAHETLVFGGLLRPNCPLHPQLLR